MQEKERNDEKEKKRELSEKVKSTLDLVNGAVIAFQEERGERVKSSSQPPPQEEESIITSFLVWPHPRYPLEPMLFDERGGPDQHAYYNAMRRLYEFLLEVPDFEVIRQLTGSPEAMTISMLTDAIRTIVDSNFIYNYECYKALLERAEKLARVYLYLWDHQRSDTYSDRQIKHAHPLEYEPYALLIYALLVLPLYYSDGRSIYVALNFMEEARKQSPKLPHINFVSNQISAYGLMQRSLAANKERREKKEEEA